MSTDKKLDNSISRWLEAEAPQQLPDRVLAATFERTRRSRQQVGIRGLLRSTNMPRFLPALAATAVVAVVALVALSTFGSQPNSGGAVPTSTPNTTPLASVPSAAPTARAAGVAEGPHLLVDEGVPMTVTIAAPGWFGLAAGGILRKNNVGDPPDGAGLIVFAGNPSYYVYGDPCKWSTAKPAKPANTVDEVIAGLAAQASRDASDPIDITLDGYTGKAITLHVPDDADFRACDQGTFGSWTLTADSSSPHRYHQGPGQIDEVWVLEVKGGLVIIDWAYYEGTPQAHVDEMRAIVESSTFE